MSRNVTADVLIGQQQQLSTRYGFGQLDEETSRALQVRSTDGGHVMAITAQKVKAAAISKQMAKVQPLTCAIGAEVNNIHLGHASRDPALMEDIRSLLLQYKVLFFQNQDMSRGEHVAFASYFGELEDHPMVSSDPLHPGLVRIYKSPDSPKERYENSWHSDATWREKPPFGCVLRCVECPPVGGDTMWANMALAYEKLPEQIKTQITGLRARHSIEATFGAAMPIEKRLALKVQYPDAEHPVVRTHPETGEKILFVNVFTTHFTNFHTASNVRVGQDFAPGGAQLLQYLISQAQIPEYQVRWRWKPNSVAFWDNRATQHYAVMDYPPCHRKMERAGIRGDATF
jgi:taurine dioxygenase